MLRTVFVSDWYDMLVHRQNKSVHSRGGGSGKQRFLLSCGAPGAPSGTSTTLHRAQDALPQALAAIARL
eukprot:5594322-Amphidinium_carterae.1